MAEHSRFNKLIIWRIYINKFLFLLYYHLQIDLLSPKALFSTVSCIHTQTLTYPLLKKATGSTTASQKEGLLKENLIRQSSVKNRPLALLFPPPTLSTMHTLPSTKVGVSKTHFKPLGFIFQTVFSTLDPRWKSCL